LQNLPCELRDVIRPEQDMPKKAEIAMRLLFRRSNGKTRPTTWSWGIFGAARLDHFGVKITKTDRTGNSNINS
jgi:hypothetical protein